MKRIASGIALSIVILLASCAIDLAIQPADDVEETPDAGVDEGIGTSPSNLIGIGTSPNLTGIGTSPVSGDVDAGVP